MLKFNSAPYTSKLISTYTLSSRQILGPTTLAAPLAILKAKCFSGQAFEIPHLYLGGFVALERKKKFFFFQRKKCQQILFSLLHISNHKGHYANTKIYIYIYTHIYIYISNYMLVFFFPESFKEPQNTHTHTHTHTHTESPRKQTKNEYKWNK